MFSGEVYFFTLFVFVYDELYGLGSKLDRKPPRKLKKDLKARLLAVGKRFKSEQVPKNVLDAVQRASSDYGRRKTRLDYLQKLCNA